MLLAAFGACAALAACATTGNDAAQAPAPRAADSPQRIASPSVRGATRGLEVWSWVVADTRWSHSHTEDQNPPADGAQNAETGEAVEETRDESLSSNGPDEPPKDDAAEPDEEVAVLKPPLYTIIDDRVSIEQALEPYLDRPIPMADDARFRWHAAGLRIVAVPISKLPELQRQLRIVGPIQRQWFGESPRWTELMRGPTFNRSQRIALDHSTAHLSPGELRLLGRAWVAPVPTPDDPLAAALRLELVPQHRPRLSETQRLLAAADNNASDRRGRVFASLSLGAHLRGEDALVIIPDAPASDWIALLDAGGNEAPSLDDQPPPDRSLGEAMLSAPAGGTSPRKRAVLILIPHVPQRFELSR